MAYAESTVGGSMGGYFRVWVNSIRTWDGGPGDNTEDWRVEGGMNRISTAGGRVWNNYNNSTYTVQLGLNGVAQSGKFNHDSTGNGRVVAWGTGATKVGRNAAGVGFGFQSRMDINCNNSPDLTAGWVTSNDAVQTKYRHATLTALSMDAGGIPGTDEGPLWLDFSNPGGAYVYGIINGPGGRLFTANGIGSRYTFPMGTLTTILQQAMPNSNSLSVAIGISDNQGGWQDDLRTRTITIKNDAGQANPLYSNFTYVDENPTTVAVTGDNQVLIQGKSDLKVTVPIADKATARKYATMSTYLFSIGAYSQSLPWSNTVDVIQDIGVVGDVSGDQTLSVRAIDSRGNGTAATKNVTILPYASPGFYNNLSIKYSNDFDIDDGIDVGLLNNTIIGSISPMTSGASDINQVPNPAGLRYDIAKDTGSYSGTWTNIPFTQEAGTGQITVDPAWLASSIQSKINGMTADNTVRWHVLFEITDKLETQYYTVSIDVGRPFFRIGADGRLYYKEIEFSDTFSGKSDWYYSSLQAYASSGTWVRVGASGYIGGWSLLYNPTGANGDTWKVKTYIPSGVYVFNVFFFGNTGGAKIDMTVNDVYALGTGFDTYNADGNDDKIFTSGTINVIDGATYTIKGKVNGRNPANTTNYINGFFGVKVERVGELP